MVVVCAIPKVYDSHSQPAYKPATSCSQLNLETTTGKEPPVTLHTNITFRPNGRLLLKQYCSDNSIRSLSYTNVPTFKPSERSRVWSVRIWHDMPRIKNLVKNQYLKTTGPCPYFGWGTSYPNNMERGVKNVGKLHLASRSKPRRHAKRTVVASRYKRTASNFNTNG